MSQGILSAVLAKSLKTKLDRYKVKSGRFSQREKLDKKTAILEINTEQLILGSTYRRVLDDPTSTHGKRLTQKQAEILVDIAKEQFNSLPTMNPEDIARSRERAKNNSGNRGRAGIFETNIRKTKTRNVYTTKIYKLGKLSTDSGINIIAEKFDRLKRQVVKPYAIKIQKFIDDTTSNMGGHTLKEFIDAGGLNIDEAETLSALFGVRKDKNLSNLAVGHIDTDIEESKRTTVQRASISLALKKTKEDGYGALGITEGQLESIINRLEAKSSKDYADLHLRYSAEHTKNTSNLRRLINLFKGEIVVYGLQSAKVNSGILRAEEQALYKKFSDEDYIKDILKELDIVNVEGSPSWLTGVFSTLEHLFMSALKKMENLAFKIKIPKIKFGKDNKTKVKGKIPFPKSVTDKLKEANKVVVDPVSIDIVSPDLNITIPEKAEKDSCKLSAKTLRAIKGKLHYNLHDAIKANMKLPALVYRTGRFAASVKVTSLIQNQDCSITAFYSYMVRPYSVFDPSISSYRGLSSPTRNPQKIIGDSIRSIAKGYMRDKYTIHPQWV